MSFAFVGDRLDLLNKQVTLEVIARPTCLETASWLPIISSITLRLIFSKYKTKIIKECRSCRLIRLPWRFRAVCLYRATVFFFLPIKLTARSAFSCSTKRKGSLLSTDQLMALFSLVKYSPWCYIIFALIMQGPSDVVKYWPLIGCCHLYQMFWGNFWPGRSHKKDYAITGEPANNHL